MLLELRIQNFAIIDSLHLEFEPGLVILTGETGAGKSIIMGALDMLLGQRVDMSTMRKGSQFASVEAVFKIPPESRAQILTLLQKEELQDSKDYLTLTRELREDRPNTARVNGLRTNVSVLVELGELLVDIHGQSEHLSLMRVNQHLGLLDRFAGTDPLLESYQETYQELHQTQQDLARLRQLDLEADKRKELLSFQVEEINLADLNEGEQKSLVEKRNRLVNAEKLAELSQNILLLLDEAPGNQPTVMDLVGQIVSSVEILARTDPSLNSLNERSAELNDGLFELGRELRVYLENLDYDAEELDQIQDRLVLIQELQRKYGETVPEILAYRDQAQQELEEITSRSSRIETLKKLELELLAELGEKGLTLSRGRQEGAERLAEQLEIQLNDLKMAGARFEVAFQRAEDPEGAPVGMGKKAAYYPDGLEKVEFLVETNPGEGLKPLAKTASGGETARLMLALKNVLAQADHIPTLVFDEIDQGIGGRIGAVVGEKLFRLTPAHQVICITHLPQLAGFGQQHFQVYKAVTDGRTTIRVREISGDDRVEELAVMLGGSSDQNRASARELLAQIGGRVS